MAPPSSPPTRSTTPRVTRCSSSRTCRRVLDQRHAQLTQPDIYFGIDYSGWVVANTKQAELDYQVDAGSKAGQPVETHYSRQGRRAPSGASSAASRWRSPGRLQLPDLEPDHSQSRVLFVRDVTQMAKKAAPFLSFDSEPYAVIANG